MKKPLYREALHHGWRLAWEHKLLWLFGLFAAFLGQMGIMELVAQFSTASADYTVVGIWDQVRIVCSALQSASLPLDGWAALAWVGVILLGFGLFFVFVSVVSQGALIHSAAASTKRLKKKLPDTDKAWHAGVTHFWRLFFLNIVKKGILALLIVLLGYVVHVAAESGSMAAAIMLGIIFVLLSIIGMIMSFWVIYAAGYVVVEEYTFIKSLKAAWKLFLSHKLVSLEVGVILLACNVVLAAFVAGGLVLTVLEGILFWLVFNAMGVPGLFVIGTVLLAGIFFLFIMFAQSIFTVFTTTTWTYLFMKMHKKGIRSRLHGFWFHKKK
ncbi:MAG: hypothetical protein HN726_01620 [Candidatus Magasanikbacteria bacterium]|jgi:hypothetical protein|nr:hypothetical protein [Candidatus Magasanikbacteria bacterium]MBT4220691.1 hypothetical protein [Candidatus Magasanikbacteria bacterium]MBT4350361.1 hypothetical protein [Candidatus Magasanikbacteria bacterium]MBT4541761.1 hypothetical protein [Candidatus Magasanikbacteria bacterium]MBT6252779.1 hypothetical protein [Candidatus Magasanikbacteria bacterium]